MILNAPETDYLYEFIIVDEIGDGNFEWVGYCEDAEDAYALALAGGYTIAHDRRVKGKQKK